MEAGIAIEDEPAAPAIEEGEADAGPGEAAAEQQEEEGEDPDGFKRKSSSLDSNKPLVEQRRSSETNVRRIAVHTLE